MICPHCLYDHPTPPRSCHSCGRRLPGERRRATPVVGRGRELALLDAELEQVRKTRKPRFIGLVGEAESGRSTLLEAVRRRHDNDFSEVSTARGYAVPGGALVDPFMPFGRVLFNALGLDAQAPAEETQRRLLEAVDALAPPSPEYLAAGLGSFFGVRLGEPVGPEEGRRRAFSAFAWYLQARARQAPLLLLIEDLAQTTPEGLALLGYLHTRLEDCALLLLAEVDQEQVGEHAALFQRYADALLEVEPLNEAGVAELLRRRTDRANPPPANLLAAIMEATGGRPRAVIHVAQALTERGYTKPGGVGWGVDPEEPVELDFPLTPEQAARARLAQLPEQTQAAMERAAVVGETFWLEALVPLWRIEQGEHEALETWIDTPSKEDVLRALAPAVEAGVVLPRAEPSMVGVTEFAFARADERALLLAEADPALRAQRHLVVAQWLEYSEVPHLSQVAEQYRQAGKPTSAARFYIEAARRARASFANESALASYEQALGLLEETHALLRLEVLHGLGALHALGGRHERAESCFSRMLALAWRLDHRAKAGAALNRLGRLQRDRSAYDRAEELLTRGRRLFEQAGDEPGVLASIDDLGQVAMLRGDREEARERFEEALRHRREAEDERAVALTLTNLARWFRDGGEAEQAERALQEASEIRERLGDLPGLLDTRLARVELRLREGWLDDAEVEAEASLEVARRTGSRGAEARGLALLGLITADKGALERAQGYGQRAEALAEQLSDSPTQSRALRAQGLAESDQEVALKLLERSVGVARRHSDPSELAAGLIRLAALHVQRAGVDLDAAAAAARRLAAEAEEEATGGSIQDLIDDALDASETLPPEISQLPETKRAELHTAMRLQSEAVDALDGLNDVRGAAHARRNMARLVEALGDVARGEGLRNKAAEQAPRPGRAVALAPVPQSE